MKAEEFGKYIKNIRNDRNLTTRQLELYSGVSNSYLSQLENGKRNIPSPDVLRKLSKGLKVPYKELLEKAGYIDEETISSHPSDLVEILKEQGVTAFGKKLTEEEKEHVLNTIDFIVKNKKK